MLNAVYGLSLLMYWYNCVTGTCSSPGSHVKYHNKMSDTNHYVWKHLEEEWKEYGANLTHNPKRLGMVNNFTTFCKCFSGLC